MESFKREVTPGGIEILTAKALKDNYVYLIKKVESSKALVIDPSESAPVQSLLSVQGISLALILNTHHHWDHVGGNLDLHRQYHAPIYCSATDYSRIPGATRGLQDRESIRFDEIEIITLNVPGHTQGQVTYFVPEIPAAFVGDTLFAMGCGRLLEGSAQQLWLSLQRLSQLPRNTSLYFGHEYALANASFALEVDPGNDAIGKRREKIFQTLGKTGFSPTACLDDELTTNPFLRAGEPEICQSLNFSHGDDKALEAFTELRRRKDDFRPPQDDLR